MGDAAVENNQADENDDNWLYGETPGDVANRATEEDGKQVQEEAGEEAAEGDEQEESEANNDDSHFNDEHFAEVAREEQEPTNGDAESQDNGDSDSDDSDDVKVTIGEIKSGPQAYASLNIKRGVGLVAAGAADKPRQGPTSGAKVTLEDLEGAGSINGVPAQEFNIDSLEDKPWNKPGADISDYFNYGFNEVTWSAYCERQRRFRVNEAGVGLHPGPPIRPTVPDNRRPPGVMQNESMPPAMQNNYQARENTIQVMTAERREYGRAVVRDAPPDYFAPPPQEYYAPPPHAPYEQSWGHPEQPAWAPSEIKELTPGPGVGGGPGIGPAPSMGGPGMGGPGMGAPSMGGMMAAPFPAPYRPHAPPPYERERLRERDDRDRRERDRRDDDERERERDRDRERSRSIKPERIREKSYRRERSRSRSRRHKSRSRSPRVRSRERERSRDRERDRDRDRDRDRERSVKPKTKEPKDKDDKE